MNLRCCSSVITYPELTDTLPAHRTAPACARITCFNMPPAEVVMNSSISEFIRNLKKFLVQNGIL